MITLGLLNAHLLNELRQSFRVLFRTLSEDLATDPFQRNFFRKYSLAIVRETLD